MSIRLVIVDDHEVTREGLAILIRDAGIEVVGQAGSGAEAISVIDSTPADVLLLDIRLPDADGLTVLEEIRAKHPDLPIVMISTFENPTYVARAVAIGAKDYILKNDSRELIVDTIERAATSQESPPRSLMQRIRSVMDLNGANNGGSDFPLTSREIQVLRHMALGLSNKEIARSLSISVETVKEHIQNVLRKLNAADRTDAAVRAVKHGLLKGI